MTFEAMKQDRKMARNAERNVVVWELQQDRKHRAKERTMQRKGMRNAKQGGHNV